jgi:hypothetical protein
VRIRAPVDICCLVDISGSMGEDAKFQDPNNESQTISEGFTQLDIVKHAVKTVMHTLAEDDRLAIVAFESTSRLVFPLRKMTDGAKKDATSVLEGLMPEDSTNIWAGLEMALDSLRNPQSRRGLRKQQRNRLRASGDEESRRNCVLLLTDGLPNIRPSFSKTPEVDKLKEYFAKNPDFRCQVNTFGFGYSLDSALLHELAVVGNGTFGFIPDAKIVGTCFVNAVANICSQLSQSCDVSLTLEGVCSRDGFFVFVLLCFAFFVSFSGRLLMLSLSLSPHRWRIVGIAGACDGGVLRDGCGQFARCPSRPIILRTTP